MAEIKGAGKKKPTLFSRLPKLGRLSQLILLVGIFLIILIPLILIQNQQKLEQTQYQEQVAMLQKILSTPYTQAATLEDQIRQADASLNLTRDKFPTIYYSREALNELFKIADSNGVDIVKAASTIGQVVITQGTVKTTYPSLQCNLTVDGDSAKIQNFIIDIKKMETCRINVVTFNMAMDINKVDEAILNLDILLQS
jgi:hypothetical protein